jgi:hypothetical protein
VIAVGCGGTDTGSMPGERPTTSPRQSTPQRSSPEIVKFDGPSFVSCRTRGEVKVLSFAYETANATAVELEIDGARTSERATDPKSGTADFEYTCPGPHTLNISVVGADKRVATDSITFDASNHASSSSSSVDVEASK